MPYLLFLKKQQNLKLSSAANCRWRFKVKKNQTQITEQELIVVISVHRLQKFKITIANTVISQDNSSLQTMGTDQMLDLFSIDEGKKGQSAAPSGSQSDQSQGKRDTVKSVLEGLGDLWDENQYEAEYDMSSFMKSLAK